MSSTIDIPCGVFLEQEALFHDDSRAAAAAGPGQSRQHENGGRGGGCTDASDACGVQGCVVPPMSQQAGHDGSTLQQSESAAVDEEERYPDNIEDFMATLLDGMKSDSVQLATSARNVVANTYQVGCLFGAVFMCIYNAVVCGGEAGMRGCVHETAGTRSWDKSLQLAQRK